MKTHRWLGSLALIILMLLAGGPGYCEERFQLAYRPAIGDQYRAKILLKYQIRQDTVDIGLALGYGLEYEVLAIDKKNTVTNRIRFQAMLLRLNGPFGVMTSFDSTDPFEEMTPENLVYAALVGSAFEYKINAAGKVLSVKGVDELIKRIDREVPDSDQKKETIKQLRSQLRQGSMIGPADNLSLYPEHPVMVGESWQALHATNSNGLMMMSEDRYEIIERRDGIVKIKITSELKPGMTNGPKNAKLEGKQWGEVEIIERNGWVNRLNLQQAITGTLSGQAGAAPQSFTMDGVITLEPF